MDVGVAVVLSDKSSRDIMDYTSECLHVSLIVELNDGALSVPECSVVFIKFLPRTQLFRMFIVYSRL